MTKTKAIELAATEPKEMVYILRLHYGGSSAWETIHANRESLLEYYFDSLDYQKIGDSFIPCWRQPTHNLKRRTYAGEKVKAVEIDSRPLYI